GWTDTDDYFAAIDRGAPVAMLPVTLPDGATLCVPNTAAIVRSCRNRPAAERLVDYLASAEGELALARSRSRQVPLGPVDNEALPAEVRALVPAARRGYRFRTLAASSAACLQFLKAEYVR
ncbi:MAG: ABC transporter substrate-binding protein, partial [Planctomycetes bacterium]|nr:ABC transporter substrate-binding protein [Planctomycetota bacterium]